ncbi:TatD family hydrolase [Myxococcota bacterium]|nr:TatD family hydrolase [Myxococcota bacterium]
MIDAHCHLDDHRFDADRAEAMEAARRVGVRGFVVAGVGPGRWERQRRLCADVADAFACYGLHPWAVARARDDGEVDGALAELERFLEEAPAVGLGETGLDASGHAPRDSLPRQERAFRAQLRLARARDLPLVLHVVRAHEEALRVVREEGVPPRGGMVHSFGGDPEQARRWIRLGLSISLGPSVCDPRAERARTVAREVPADALLIETDCPDQAPWPDRGLRNEPSCLARVALAVAAIRDEDPRSLGDRAARNAARLFRLPADPR